MRDLKVAMIQCPPLWEDIDGNLALFEKRIRTISAAPDIILLPEMFTTGFSMRAAELAVGCDDEPVRWMKFMSSESGAAIAGSMIIREDGLYYNRMIFAGPDGSIASYDKRHLFRMGGEHTVFSAGTLRTIIAYRGWKIAPFICYDLRFPCWSRNRMKGYDIALYSANWPEARSMHWDTLLRARAVENQCYVVACNRTGTDGNGVSYIGGSAVIDPRGWILARDEGVDTILEAVLSHKSLHAYRDEFPVLLDADESGDMR